MNTNTNDLSDMNNLSEREKQLLTLTACGLSSREIAEYLVISHHTVNTHFSNIFGKLCAVNKTQAVIRAIQQGSITLEEIKRCENAMELS